MAGCRLVREVAQIIHDPDKIFGDYIKPGILVIYADYGMGYMAVGAASAVSESGKVINNLSNALHLV